MIFLLNNEEIDIQLENEKTVGEVLTNFQILCEKNNATIIGINIDDQNIDADKIEQHFNTDINNIEKLNISTVCLQDIYLGFANINQLCNEITSKLEDIPVQLQNNQDNIANKTITDFTYLFDSFCRITTLATIFPDLFEKLKIDDKSLHIFLQEDFSPILADFEQAIKSKDTILIGDLAEYEILPKVELIKEFTKQFCETN